MKLYQLLNTMEISLENLRRQSLNYPNSREFKKFLSWKEDDLRSFKRLVGNFRDDAFVPDVVNWLKDHKVDYKYFGMTQRPEGYFQVTKKLQKALDAGL